MKISQETYEELNRRNHINKEGMKVLIRMLQRPKKPKRCSNCKSILDNPDFDTCEQCSPNIPKMEGE